MIIDTLIILFVAFALYGCNFAPKNQFHTDYISIDNSNIIKGLFAAYIVFHHLSKRTSCGIIFRVFAENGYLPVAIFFFITGYGLVKSYQTRHDYLQHFILKRLPPVLVPFLLIAVVYWIQYCIQNQTILGPISILHMMKSEILLVKFSWYVIVILIYYIWFWFFARFAKNDKHFIFINVAFAIVWWGICNFYIGYSSMWYGSCLAIASGSILAVYQSNITKFVERHYISLLFVLAFTFITIIRFTWPIISHLPIADIAESHSWFISLFITESTSMLFPFIIFMIAMKLKLKNKLLVYLGKWSYEIYITHGLFVIAFDFLKDMSEQLYCILIIFATLPTAALLWHISKKVLGSYKKWLETKI